MMDDVASGGIPSSGNGGNESTPSGGAASGGNGASGTGGGDGGTTTQDCSSLPLCDDFESAVVGSAPPAPWGVRLDDPNGGTVVVTSEDAHSGTQSVKVDGEWNTYGLTYQPSGDRYYLRAYLKIQNLDAGNPAIVGIGPTSDEMRMRLFKKGTVTEHVVSANAANGDGMAPPEASGSGPCADCAFLPSEWFCLEMFVDRTAEDLTIWVDGALAASIEGNVGWAHNATWPQHVESLWIGSMALEGGGATVYIDDVALGPERIGCALQ